MTHLVDLERPAYAGSVTNTEPKMPGPVLGYFWLLDQQWDVPLGYVCLLVIYSFLFCCSQTRHFHYLQACVIAMYPIIEAGIPHVVIAIAIVLSSPFLLWGRIEKKYDRQRAQGQRRNRGLLPPKLPRRRRALTLVREGFNQEQCLLLSILPLELRQLIWNHCLGTITYHIYCRGERMRVIICTALAPHDCYRHGMSRECSARVTNQASLELMPSNCLPVLRTCHTMSGPLFHLFLSLLIIKDLRGNRASLLTEYFHLPRIR